jgi:hypothetical protein
MEFGDFDDEFFDSKSKKNTNDFQETIKNYKAKIVTPKVNHICI